MTDDLASALLAIAEQKPLLCKAFLTDSFNGYMGKVE
jgi:hypothetical protein